MDSEAKFWTLFWLMAFCAASVIAWAIAWGCTITGREAVASGYIQIEVPERMTTKWVKP